MGSVARRTGDPAIIEREARAARQAVSGETGGVDAPDAHQRHGLPCPVARTAESVALLRVHVGQRADRSGPGLTSQHGIDVIATGTVTTLALHTWLVVFQLQGAGDARARGVATEAIARLITLHDTAGR